MNMRQYYDMNPWEDITTTLHFANMAGVALYRCELEGQISDGLYENRFPYYHWKWIWDTKPVLSDQTGYEMSQKFACEHRVKYSLRSLISHIGKNDDWDWTERILDAGKLGSIIPEDKLEVFWKEADDLNSTLSYLKKGIDTVEELVKSLPDYAKEYAKKCTLLTDELIKKFRESTYSLKDLKRDANLLSQTVNSRIM